MSSEAPICEEEPLTQEFVDFAHENAKKIYEKVNELGRVTGKTPPDPDTYDPVSNPNGLGKKNVLWDYYIINEFKKSPFENDSEKEKFFRVIARLL